ncbi:hypothetical protein Peur_054931 [Populus x canadensis]
MSSNYGLILQMICRTVFSFCCVLCAEKFFSVVALFWVIQGRHGCSLGPPQALVDSGPQERVKLKARCLDFPRLMGMLCPPEK